MKSRIIFAVLCVEVIAIVFSISGCNKEKSEAIQKTKAIKRIETQTQPKSEQVPDKVIVYYFYGNHRCSTCIKMEKLADQAITTEFVEELNNQKLEWHVVNTDEKINEHFKKDFELYTKSLVVVAMKDGKRLKWKKCEKIWDFVSNPPEFLKYVKAEVHSYLGSK